MPCRKITTGPLPPTLRAMRGAGPTMTVSTLFRLGAGNFHRAGAALAVLPEIRGEILRRAADDFVAAFMQVLAAELRLLEDFSRVEVNSFHHIPWRARGQ